MSGKKCMQLLEKAYLDGDTTEFLELFLALTDVQIKYYVVQKIEEDIQECLSPTPRNPSLNNILHVLTDLVEAETLSFESATLLAKCMFQVVAQDGSIPIVKSAIHIVNKFLYDHNLVEWINQEECLEEQIQILGRSLPITGDFECQALIFEVLCRIANDNHDKWVNAWFSDDKIRSLFLNLNPQQFELECRKILNNINRNKAQPRVSSSVAISVSFGSFQLKKPYGSDFWIDFNYDTESISFFCSEISEADQESSSWDTIVILSDNVESYVIQSKTEQKTKELCIYLKSPCSDLLSPTCTALPKLEMNLVKITFWSVLAIAPQCRRIFENKCSTLPEQSSGGFQSRKVSNCVDVVSCSDAKISQEAFEQVLEAVDSNKKRKLSNTHEFFNPSGNEPMTTKRQRKASLPCYLISPCNDEAMLQMKQRQARRSSMSSVPVFFSDSKEKNPDESINVHNAARNDTAMELEVTEAICETDGFVEPSENSQSDKCHGTEYDINAAKGSSTYDFNENSQDNTMKFSNPKFTSTWRKTSSSTCNINLVDENNCLLPLEENAEYNNDLVDVCDGENSNCSFQGSRENSNSESSLNHFKEGTLTEKETSNCIENSETVNIDEEHPIIAEASLGEQLCDVHPSVYFKDPEIKEIVNSKILEIIGEVENEFQEGESSDSQQGSEKANCHRKVSQSSASKDMESESNALSPGQSDVFIEIGQDNQETEFVNLGGQEMEVQSKHTSESNCSFDDGAFEECQPPSKKIKRSTRKDVENQISEVSRDVFSEKGRNDNQETEMVNLGLEEMEIPNNNTSEANFSLDDEQFENYHPPLKTTKELHRKSNQKNSSVIKSRKRQARNSDICSVSSSPHSKKLRRSARKTVISKNERRAYQNRGIENADFETRPVRRRRVKAKTIFCTDTETVTGSSEASWFGKKKMVLFESPRRTYSCRRKSTKTPTPGGARMEHDTIKAGTTKKKRSCVIANTASGSEKSKSGLSELEHYQLVVEKNTPSKNTSFLSKQLWSLPSTAKQLPYHSVSDESLKGSAIYDNIDQDFAQIESNEPCDEILRNNFADNVSIPSIENVTAFSNPPSNTAKPVDKNLSSENSIHARLSKDKDWKQDVLGTKNMTSKKWNHGIQHLPKRTLKEIAIPSSSQRGKHLNVSLSEKKTKRKLESSDQPSVNLDDSPACKRQKKFHDEEINYSDFSSRLIKTYINFPNIPIAVETLVSVSPMAPESKRGKRIVNPMVEESFEPAFNSYSIPKVLSQESLSSLCSETEGKKLHMERYFQSISNDSSSAKEIEDIGNASPISYHDNLPIQNKNISSTQSLNSLSVKSFEIGRNSYVEEVTQPKEEVPPADRYLNYKDQKKRLSTPDDPKLLQPTNKKPNHEWNKKLENYFDNCPKRKEVHVGGRSPISKIKHNTGHNFLKHVPVFFRLTKEVTSLTRRLLSRVQKYANDFRVKIVELRESIVTTAEVLISNELDLNVNDLKHVARNCKESRILIQKSLKKIMSVGRVYFETEQRHDRRLERLTTKAAAKYCQCVKLAEGVAVKTLEERAMSETKALFRSLMRNIKQI